MFTVQVIFNSLCLMISGHGVVPKFLMTGLLGGVTAQVTVIRMCPPLTTKNWNIYDPLLAVGMKSLHK